MWHFKRPIIKIVTRRINNKSWLSNVTLFLIGVGLYIVFAPFVILLLPFIIYSYFDNLAFKRKYKDYLQKINGSKFFCYNNKTETKNFIEKEILPKLSADIKIIYLDGRTPKTEYNQKFISRAIYGIKDNKGFPYLLKVSNGQMLDKSINNDFYNTMRQNKNTGQLIENINLFFQSA